MAESGENRHPLQKRWLVIAGIVVLALIFLIPFFKDGGARVDTRVEMDTRSAFIGNVEETTSGEGRITEIETFPAQAPYAGRIAEVSVKNGDVVKTGDVLAVYDSEDLDSRMDAALEEIEKLDEQIEELGQSVSFDLTAEQAGLVKTVNAGRGDATDSGDLVVLSTDDLLKVCFEAQHPEVLKKGDGVRVRLDGHKAEGTVKSIEDGTVTVTFPDQKSYELGTEAEIQDKGGNLLGSGRVEANAVLVLTSDRHGVVTKSEVKAGDRVEEGDCLLRCIDVSLDESCEQLVEQRKAAIDLLVSLRSFRQQPEITAENDGIVTDLSIAEQDEVEANQQLCTLTAQQDYILTVNIPLWDGDRVREGQKAELTFGNVTYEATVMQQDQQADRKSIVCPVKVALSGVDGRKIGDEAHARIILAQASDAVLVPVKAVQTQEDGTETVSVYYGDGLTRSRGVITGLTDGVNVQILQGLEDGEEVVVSSHLVETTFYSLLNFEWIVGEKEGATEDGLVSDPNGAAE